MCMYMVDLADQMTRSVRVAKILLDFAIGVGRGFIGLMNAALKQIK